MTLNDIDLNIVVQEDYEVKTSPYNGKYSKSALFLLPMLGLNVRNIFISKYIKNVFIDDEGLNHNFSNPIFILFQVKNLREKEWQNICSTFLTKDPIKNYRVLDYYVGSIDNYHLIMYVFETPTRYIEDYKNFIQGRYSKMSDEYKSKFPQKVTNAAGEQVESLVWGAMYKSNALKNLITKEFNVDKKEISKFRNFVDTFDEIWDSPKNNEEIYRYGTKKHTPSNRGHSNIESATLFNT